MFGKAHSQHKQEKKVKNSAGSKLKSKQLKLRCGGGGQIKHLVKGGLKKSHKNKPKNS